MPTGQNEPSSSSNPAQRTTFRPPWVKEGPNPLPVPPAPWTLKQTATNRRDSTTKDEPNPLLGVQLRKTSIKDPAQLQQQQQQQENGAASKENTFKRPQLRPVPPKEEVKVEKEKLPPVKLNSVADRKLPEPKKVIDDDQELDKVLPATRNALVRAESLRRLSQTPAPPPMPPPAPAMPGMPFIENKKPLTERQKDRIDSLKKCPKVRPDWTAMLKEIEGNRKLKHVECNDRSEPLLPQTKATEHFVFESETANVHNELLKQIQSGIQLKRVKTNDRSKPMLDGLRKFRRQMTIEEQIQKSVSMASMPPEEIEDEVDEMDDIDKVRDDLQSTKQMLALELRNKEAQIRENKRLMARIQNLEAELEKERNNKEKATNNSSVDDKLIASLKKEAEEARKTSEEVERKFTEISEHLGNTKFQLEEQKKQNQQLEKKLMEALQGKRGSVIHGLQELNGGGGAQDLSEDEIFLDDEVSEESDGEDSDEKKERRAQRELKQLRNKLRNFKNKEDNAKKERLALREILKRHQQAIKEEKKKYKALQKEVDKMAALMKDVDENEEDEEEEDAEEEEKEDVEEEEEDEESSSESESEESEDDSDSERSQSEDEDAPVEKKKANLLARSDRHEKILGALKKGNFLLKANAERLQDDLNKQKELTANLQEDLDSVLAELG